MSLRILILCSTIDPPEKFVTHHHHHHHRGRQDGKGQAEPGTWPTRGSMLSRIVPQSP